MIICIDCRMINASGIGVYLRECLPFLFESEHSFLLLGDKDTLARYKKEASNAIVIICAIKPFSPHELIFFPKSILQKINTADLFYSPFFNIPRGVTIPVFTTIHDIIFPDMPELTSKTGLAARMWFYRRAYKKSQKIFTVSEFSKSRIERHLGTEKPVIVTYSAIQPMFLAYRNSAGYVQKKETIVFIGNIKKHKGLDCLIDAFILAKDEGLPHKLLIIGEKEKFRTTDNAIQRKIESIGSESVTFTGFISDERLMEYLAEASLLVQPSLYEGFCLPPLEAMVLGTQVLISDIPVLKEVYKDYPVTFFHAGDANDLKQKIVEQLFNRATEKFPLPDYLAQEYTFEKTARIILENAATMRANK